MRPVLSTLAAATLLTLLTGTAAHADHPVPGVIPLPDGFRPEGIEAGRDHVLYVANFDTGAIFQADARAGTGRVLVPDQTGRQGLGLKLDRRSNLLIVSGGGTGHAYAYDARTGAGVADFTLATGTTFVNDVVLTPRAAYFTDSFRPVLYKLPLGHHGELPSASAVQTIPLSGDFVFDSTPGAFNNNGIVAIRPDRLIIVNSATGKLYDVDANTGSARLIDLGGQLVVNGDGLVLRGHTLFVVENFTNRIDVVELSHRFDHGTIDEVITDARFDVPATAALLGGALYVTNARFTTPHTPTTPYTVVRVALDRDDCDD